MSETMTTFPFEASLDNGVEPETPDRRKLFVLLAVGVLIAALLGYFVAVPLLSADKVTSPPPVVGHAAAAGAKVNPVVPPKVVPKTFAGVTGKDPFHPLVRQPAAGAAGTSTTTTSTTAPAAGSTVTQPATTPATTPGMVTFKVLSVSGSKATVSVDTKKYTASVGQVFAKSYKLLKTSGGSCAAFVYGEMRFSLCEGQTFIF